MHAIEKIVKTVRRGDSVTEGELTMIPLLNDASRCSLSGTGVGVTLAFRRMVMRLRKRICRQATAPPQRLVNVRDELRSG